MASLVSLRRPKRNYQQQIKWSYSLNKELNKMYEECDPTKSGFTKRLKSLWDAQHPDMPLTAKHLNEQAKRIIKKSLVFNSNFKDPIDQRNKGSVTACDESGPDNCALPTDWRPDFLGSRNSTDALIEPAQDSIDPSFVALWNANMQALYELPLQDRPYVTKVRKKPNEEILRAADYLAEKHLAHVLLEAGSVELRDLNATLYVAAVTVQMAIKDIRLKNRTKSTKKIGWIANLEHHIESLRRKISHIAVIIQCKMENNYTRHQKQLQLKLEKQFGNTKLKTLHSRLLQSKQDLKASSEKLRYQRKQMLRNDINRKFMFDQKSIYRTMKGCSKTP